VILGLGYKLRAVMPVAGQLTHGTTFRAFKVTSRVAIPAAESSVFDISLLRHLAQLFSLLTLKMHDLKMTDIENYGSGKCRTGK